MMQPPGLGTDAPNLICQLHKVIYKLKQVLRLWFQKLNTTLISFDFSSTKSDSSLFVKFYTNIVLFILIYVDNIIITRSSSLAI